MAGGYLLCRVDLDATTADLRAVPRVAFNLIDVCLIFSRLLE